VDELVERGEGDRYRFGPPVSAVRGTPGNFRASKWARSWMSGGSRDGHLGRHVDLSARAGGG
jgi:hypothetical protein